MLCMPYLWSPVLARHGWHLGFSFLWVLVVDLPTNPSTLLCMLRSFSIHDLQHLQTAAKQMLTVPPCMLLVVPEGDE